MNKISFSLKRCTRVLTAAALLFVIMHLVLQYFFYVQSTELLPPLRDRLSLDSEISLPTWFSQQLLFIAALLLAAIARLKTQTQETYRTYWLMLSAIFLYLSIDEGASLHEIPVERLRTYFGITSDFSLLAHAWVILAVPLLLLIGLVFWRFLRALPALTRRRFITAAAVYIGGAVGMEIIGGSFFRGNFFHFGVALALEEGLEMLGIILFIRALLLHLTDQKPTLTLRLDSH